MDIRGEAVLVLLLRHFPDELILFFIVDLYFHKMIIYRDWKYDTIVVGLTATNNVPHGLGQVEAVTNVVVCHASILVGIY
jgi:hypothetical protein